MSGTGATAPYGREHTQRPVHLHVHPMCEASMYGLANLPRVDQSYLYILVWCEQGCATTHRWEDDAPAVSYAWYTSILERSPEGSCKRAARQPPGTTPPPPPRSPQRPSTTQTLSAASDALFSLAFQRRLRLVWMRLGSAGPVWHQLVMTSSLWMLSSCTRGAGLVIARRLTISCAAVEHSINL